jgi:PAS domain-containing protein
MEVELLASENKYRKTWTRCGRMKNHFGSAGVFKVHAFPLPGGRLAVSFEDITERKNAEETLRENEQRLLGLYGLLADAEEAAHMGSWTWDVATDTVTWSDNLFRLFGRDPQSGAPSFAEHDPLYTPESMARLRKAVDEILHEGTTYALDLEAVRSDGTIVRCVARGKADLNEEGVVTRLFGSFQEVTS